MNFPNYPSPFANVEATNAAQQQVVTAEERAQYMQMLAQNQLQAMQQSMTNLPGPQTQAAEQNSMNAVYWAEKSAQFHVGMASGSIQPPNRKPKKAFWQYL
ncbi:MAG TPA: hypothetical protein DCE41_24665 [Cytophagales bacterium]|nr:hypothetical protein [Cytophagales bacterium]HAA22729.1 hypothetical protein [Cytophagales bacterium]HAP60317.1 hypothetical protein [Cytophagales bacterium]